MTRNCFGRGARLVAGGLAGLACLFAGRGPAFAAEPPKAAAPEAPVVLLKPTQRDGHVSPYSQCSSLTGGAVTVLQPAPDQLIITLTGAAAAKANPFAPSTASLEAAVE
jgi:hypothetical protein